jgi:hypothetical protein
MTGFDETGGHREQSSKLWSRRRELVVGDHRLSRGLRFVTTKFARNTTGDVGSAKADHCDRANLVDPYIRVGPSMSVYVSIGAILLQCEICGERRGYLGAASC